MKIAIDIDNIICNTTEEIIHFINERLPNIHLEMEDITNYWIEKALPEEYQWIVPLAFEQKEVWKKVKLIDGAAQYIQKLYEDGHEIYFATATTAENFRKKVGFLTRSFPFFPEDYVRMHSISIKHKQLLNVDVLIDDYLNNLIGDRKYCSICMDYPWNRDYEDNGCTFRRAYNWADAYEIIKHDCAPDYLWRDQNGFNS